MEGDYARAPADGIEQRCDIGKPDDCLGTASNGLVVDPVEQSNGTVAAANAPDCIDRGVAQRLVEISESLIVGTGQVPVSAIGVLAEYGDVAQRTAKFFGSG
jgi:hypothetical protein